MHEKQASWFKVSFVMAHEPELTVLFSRTQIAERVASLAATISRDFANEHVVLIGVLKGAAIFMSDLALAKRVGEIGAELTRDFAGQRVIFVGILKGASVFLADLARTVQLDATFDFMSVTSYGKGDRSSGEVKLIKDLDQSVHDKNVILVEDILDTGLTLTYLRRIFLLHQPKVLRIATLLDKPSRRLEPLTADYVGFTIEDNFVVGYGMDFDERYRNLPDICILMPRPQ